MTDGRSDAKSTAYVIFETQKIQTKISSPNGDLNLLIPVTRHQRQCVRKNILEPMAPSITSCLLCEG